MTTAGRRWPSLDLLPVGLVPFLAGALQVVGSAGADHNGDMVRDHPHTPLDWFGYLLLVAGPVALVHRRRHPVAVLAVAAAATAIYHVHGYVNGPFFVAVMVALVAAVTRGHRRAAWVTAVLLIAVILATGIFGRSLPLVVMSRPGPPVVAGLLLWAFAVLAGAEAVRDRAEAAAKARRIREEEERRLAGEERLRIARELHDVLAHNISMINVQAGVALHLMDERPEQARTALAAIKAASKEALTEMRSVIGVLRQDEAAPRAPAPGLDRLEALAAQARGAGLRVTVYRRGEPRPLPAGTDLAAFRIAQESLTNATRHARPPASGLEVRITVEQAGHAVTVTVDDNGVPSEAAPDGGGSGIPGMRERAAALGGTFAAGWRVGGGYRVRAELPAGEET